MFDSKKLGYYNIHSQVIVYYRFRAIKNADSTLDDAAECY